MPHELLMGLVLLQAGLEKTAGPEPRRGRFTPVDLKEEIEKEERRTCELYVRKLPLVMNKPQPVGLVLSFTGRQARSRRPVRSVLLG